MPQYTGAANQVLIDCHPYQTEKSAVKTLDLSCPCEMDTELFHKFLQFAFFIVTGQENSRNMDINQAVLISHTCILIDWGEGYPNFKGYVQGC